MAKASKKTTTTAKASEYEIPEGFSINVGRERGDGWAKKQEGNVVQGRLLGRYTYLSRGKKRAYYQVKLSVPCIAEIENPEWNEEDPDGMKENDIPERVTATLDEGAIINLDETTKLSDLESYASNGGTYDLWLVFGKKVEIGNGQTMWNITGPRLAMVRKPNEIPG